MPGLKRKSAQPSSSSRPSESAAGAKKPRSEEAPRSSLVDAAQVDFPRGGGSGLTPFEHASTLREARSELAKSSRGDDDLFKSGKAASSSKHTLTEAEEQKRRDDKRRHNREKNNAKKKKTTLPSSTETEDNASKSKGKDHIRIEHLNYKRLTPGTRLLCSIVAVHPLALILSLPNQLVGHVPITAISSLFTQKLHEAAEMDSDDEKDSDDEDDEAEVSSSTAPQPTRLATGLPELKDCFKVGQWVRAAVSHVNAPGVKRAAASGNEAHEFDKESRRVELTLDPEAINEGVSPGDLSKGFVLPVTIKSKEDHGFLLDSGIEGVQGFAAFNQVEAKSVYIGQVLDAAIASVASQGRSFTATLKSAGLKSAILGPEDAPSSTALVPGCQVTGLITAALPTGLNVKLWGMFDATIDNFHLSSPLPPGKEMHQVYKVGSKIKARIIWESRKSELGGLGDDEASTSRAVALSAAPHVLALSPPEVVAGQSLQEAYPIGSTVEARVIRTDSDWGLTCTIEDDKTRLLAFTHISRVSDDHVVKLPSKSGPFALNTSHTARVVGHAPTDRMLLLSFQKSVLDKSFMRVNEVEIGSSMRATISRIGPNGSAIFLNLGGAFEGVVFPLHFADVPLKRPEKKYKPGATVKARVLNVDPARNRIVCTLKKSLVTSELPVVASFQDARVGVVTHATVSKFVDTRGIIVDLFGGLRAFVPTSEATESPLGPSAPSLQTHFYEGKVVKMRLTNVDYENQKLLASIKQASASFLAKLDVAAVQIGEKVSATVAAIHQDVVVLELEPSKVRGLLSLSVLASQRKSDVEAVRESLQDGETLSDLIVVDKHADRGIVIVGDANAPARKPSAHLSEPLNPGTLQTGRVNATSGEVNAVTVFLAGGCRGRLHITDVADDFDSAELPRGGENVQVHLIRLRNSGKRADVTLRPSKTDPSFSGSVKDAEVDKAGDLAIGDRRRGFVKAISSAGLFVDLGRGVTARVLIAELFDDYVKEWQARFSVGQLVAGTVTAVDAADSKVELSLRTNPGSSKKSKADRAAEKAAAKAEEKAKFEAGQLKIQDLRKGMKVNAFVRAVQDYGVFVQIENTQISGLAHKSQLTDNTSATSDPTKAFSVGDRVKAFILDVHAEKRKVDFALKPSYFSAEDFEESEDEEGDEDEEDGNGELTNILDDASEDGENSSDDEGDDEEEEDDVDDSDLEVDAEALLREDSDDDAADLLKLNGEDEEEDDSDDEEGEGEDSDSEEDEEDENSELGEDEAPTPSTSSGKIQPLELSAGFSWSAPDINAPVRKQDQDDSAGEEDSDDDDDDDDDGAGEDGAHGLNSSGNKASLRGKRGARRALEDDLTADLATKTPESSADFERMLLSSPNSSYLWIQFMSFQLQLSEVDAARDVARRALKVINYRDEGEKLNVWIALLNLENTYGTDETLEAVFREATQYNDAKTIHQRLASILESTGKVDKAADLWQRTVKKFGAASVEVWVGAVQFYLRVGRADEGRGLLPRAIQSLGKSKEVAVITGFALSEYKVQPGGDIERGRTFFEGLVDSYPKRLDLWWQYLDQEISVATESPAQVRLLFERVLNLRQSTKKGKSILKKWLDFEKAKGDAKGERAVLDRARKFVEDLKARQQASAVADADEEMVDEESE